MSSLNDFYVPIEFKNLKLCCDLNNFKFIDWNENENVIYSYFFFYYYLLYLRILG
jgi:hypothetical protein